MTELTRLYNESKVYHEAVLKNHEKAMNAGRTIDEKARIIQAEKGLTYEAALEVVRLQEPELWRIYINVAADGNRSISQDYSRS